MAGFKATLKLTGNSISLKKLTSNIVNTHLNQLNDAFELLHKEDIKENTVYFENVYNKLADMDIFQHFRTEPDQISYADSMAEFFESTKSTFVSKMDLKTAILMRTHGIEGIVTKPLLNMLYGEKEVPIDYKKIERIVKIHASKEDLTMFDKIYYKNGNLLLEYTENRKYCLGGKHCNCQNTDESDDKIIQIFEFKLKGELENLYWHMIEPDDMFLPLNMLNPYIQKKNQINQQRSIYRTYSDLYDGNRIKFSPNLPQTTDNKYKFLDFTLSFWNATLRITETKGTFKYKDFVFKDGLDICVYENEFSRILDDEFERKWSFFGIHKKMQFKMGIGLVFEILQRKKTFSNISSELMNNSLFQNSNETHIFKTPEDFNAFLNTYHITQFFNKIMSVLEGYDYPIIKNYNEQVFGDKNVMIRKNNDFIVVCSRLWIGKNVQYGIMRHKELFICDGQVTSQKTDSTSSTNSENPLAYILDIDLLFLINELFLFKGIHFILNGMDLKFDWMYENFKFPVLIRSLKDLRSHIPNTFFREEIEKDSDSQATNTTPNNKFFNQSKEFHKSLQNSATARTQNIFLAIVRYQNQLHPIFITQIEELKNFLTFLLIKFKLVKDGNVLEEPKNKFVRILENTDQDFQVQELAKKISDKIKNDIFDYEGIRTSNIFCFKFYNLQVAILFDRKLVFECVNILSKNLINSAIDKNTILLDILVYLNAIKPLIRTNIKPVVFTSDFMMFWFGQKIILRYRDGKYFWNDDELEKVADHIKQKAVSWKMAQIGKKLEKWQLDQKSPKNSHSDIHILHFRTEVGNFDIFTEKSAIILKITKIFVSNAQKQLLEQFFYKLFNSVDEYLNHIEILITKEKCLIGLEKLKRK
ncbi:hypothetical protein M153_1222000209 [Pseudoloma neurophilia]|uniref:Uncharacterized protein n=1 Tax=Pseudoloma neurophilia TaxID=146866 RepID=A0A0R0LZD3_9MICR|nr:hypothetical protein M153_1222000209 [Pseudoloma neurophilia]